MNMADQNWVGSVIWLTTKSESWVPVIGYYSQVLIGLSISRFSAKDSFVFRMYTCTCIHNQWWSEMADQSSKCPTNIILRQPFVLTKVKCYFYHCYPYACLALCMSSPMYVYTYAHPVLCSKQPYLVPMFLTIDSFYFYIFFFLF